MFAVLAALFAATARAAQRALAPLADVQAYVALFDAAATTLTVAYQQPPLSSSFVPKGLRRAAIASPVPVAPPSAARGIAPISDIVGKRLWAAAAPRAASHDLRRGFVPEGHVVRADCAAARDVGAFTSAFPASAPPRIRQSFAVVPIACA